MSFKTLSRPTVALLFLAMAFATTPVGNAQSSRSRYNRPAQNDRAWTVPDDSIIPVSMNDSLSSKSSRVGDRFTATVTMPLDINGETVIPAGAVIEGRVTQVKPARRMGKSGAIAVDFDELVFPNGSRVSLVGNLTSDDPEIRRRIDDENRVSGEKDGKSAVFVGSSGAMGAVLGGIMGGAKGAIAGGVIGAGVGAATVLLSKGEEAYVAQGTPFGVQLRQPILIRETYLDGSTTATVPDNVPADNTADPPDLRRQPENRDTTPIRQPEDPAPDPVREPETEPEPEASQPPESLPPAENLPLSSTEMIRRSQLALRAEGYYEGATDGVLTPRFSSALKAYQRENKLPETGELDAQTAKKLGILAASPQPARAETRPAANNRTNNAESNVVLANVISATARRTDQGAISVSIETQANTGGWRWYGDSVVNGDTLEVYARAVRPTGMVTQALTRGRIDLTVRDNVEYVKRVVVHSANNDQVIALTGVKPAVQPAIGTTGSNASAISIQRQAEELLAEYQRISGVRLTGASVEMDNRAGNKDAEIELLFAIDSFVNAAQLYMKMAGALQDRQSLRSATLAMARQARKTDRVISTSNSPAADRINLRWDAIRQDVLKLMQTYNINASELDQ